MTSRKGKRELKRYELSDGTTINFKELAERANISESCAKSRLGRTGDIKTLFAPVGGLQGNSNQYKVYTLSDGSEWTIPQLCKHLGIEKKSTVAARLHKTLDISHVLRPYEVGALENKAQEEITKEQTTGRMYGNDFWRLLARNT